MKKVLMYILVFLLSVCVVNTISAQVPTVDPIAPRYAACDVCGYCPPIPAPQSWTACQKCVYPNINPDPSVKESLIVDAETNLPIAPALGRQYTFLGCLKGGAEGFGEGAGSVVQTLVNIIFSMVGGIAFLYLLYGSFVIATSQSNPEKLNYGKRVIYGAIIGLIFTLSSVFIVKLIASGILKIPGFGE